MSGLAEILVKEGFRIDGSDRDESDVTRRLVESGINVKHPQKAENVPADADFVVYTAAISEENPEYIRCKELNLPMMTRAELLGQISDQYKRSIAVSGTHGKTTTTSMLSQILMHGQYDPTISVGGILSAIGGNVRYGSSDVFLTEACEYTNSFLSLHPKYSVILNVEADHLDFFKDLDDIRHSFSIFASQTADDGFLIINAKIDDYKDLCKDVKAKVITFGDTPEADMHAADISYDDAGCPSFTPTGTLGEFPRISLKVPGHHNIENALAAIATAHAMGISVDDICGALETFTGVGRRFEYKGTKNGITIIDDYAHHPTEIAATIAAARNASHNRLVVAFQPHTYTRTLALLDDFAAALSKADLVLLGEIYAAREKDIYGIHSKDLAAKINELGTECYSFEDFSQIEKFILKNCVNGDLLITMGAGNIYLVGEHLL